MKLLALTRVYTRVPLEIPQKSAFTIRKSKHDNRFTAERKSKWNFYKYHPSGNHELGRSKPRAEDKNIPPSS
jgi:hypothetical protein